MKEEQFLWLAGHRLFMFNLKLYFPEYLKTSMPASKYPFDNERFKAHLSMCSYMYKRPFSERLFVLFAVIDEREVEYLCLGKKPKSLIEENESIIKEAERIMAGESSKIIIFPPRAGGL